MSAFPLARRTAVGVTIATGGVFLAFAPSHLQPGPATPTAVLNLLSALPMATISRASAAVAGIPIPSALRARLYSSYCRDAAAEAELELVEYRSFADFFARKLRKEVRPLDTRADVISPVDGTIVASGTLEARGVLPSNVKGVEYTARELLNAGDHDPLTHRSHGESALKTELYAVVIRIGPWDCHRFRSPAVFRVAETRRIPGGLHWIDSPTVDGAAPAYVRNERVALVGAWTGGMFSCTAIGGPGVGSIVLDGLDLASQTKAGDVPLKPGDEVGGFRMGSAIVLIFEAPVRGFKFDLGPGSRVRTGEGIGRLVSRSRDSTSAVSRAELQKHERASTTGIRTRRSW